MEMPPFNIKAECFEGPTAHIMDSPLKLQYEGGKIAVETNYNTKASNSDSHFILKIKKMFS